jgi:hypothetical protein
LSGVTVCAKLSHRRRPNFTQSPIILIASEDASREGPPWVRPADLDADNRERVESLLHRAFPRCRVQGSCPMSACRIARRSCGEFGGAPAHRFYRVDDLEYLAAFAGASRLPREGHIAQHDSAIDRVSQCGFLSVRFLFGDTLSVFLGFRPVLRHITSRANRHAMCGGGADVLHRSR